ncbi:MAG: enoyl-CoA hydratase/isomerase family protein [Rhodospirillales bacterium]|nr:enoyl-CoA hydratase/isomerase family protein [Rhodospirillales bacterium]
MTSALLCTVDARGVATLTLNRPAVHNAFDDALIAELTAALKRLGADPAVRVVMLAANGKSFSAGADLNWMRRMAGYSEAENRRDAEALAELMRTLNFLPKPTVAKVQGPAYAGGCGLIAGCDIAIAADTAKFAITEAKLGLIPAVISLYVIAAIGERAARRYFLTAESFDAAEAVRLGLIHVAVAPARLDVAAERICDLLVANGPAALTECKNLVHRVSRRPVDETIIADTADRIARIRASAEGREGIAAFLEKRKPVWKG